MRMELSKLLVIVGVWESSKKKKKKNEYTGVRFQVLTAASGEYEDDSLMGYSAVHCR
jgi:hypothetical protein